MPSPLPKHYSIPKTSFLVNAEVGTIPHNRPVLNKKPDRTFESAAGLLSAGR